MKSRGGCSWSVGRNKLCKSHLISSVPCICMSVRYKLRCLICKKKKNAKCSYGRVVANCGCRRTKVLKTTWETALVAVGSGAEHVTSVILVTDSVFRTPFSVNLRVPYVIVIALTVIINTFKQWFILKHSSKHAYIFSFAHRCLSHLFCSFDHRSWR